MCRRRLTARAVGTISKQAGLSIPGISGQEIRNDCWSATWTWKHRRSSWGRSQRSAIKSWLLTS